MKKLLLLLTIPLFLVSHCMAQMRLPGSSNKSSNDGGRSIDFSGNPDLEKDIEQTGLAVANKLMRCCSSYGGNNLSADISWNEVRLSQASGTFTIPMTVSWTGSLSGTHYWIKGQLLIDGNGGKQWLKVSDSGGFSGGCSGGCIN